MFQSKVTHVFHAPCFSQNDHPLWWMWTFLVKLNFFKSHIFGNDKWVYCPLTRLPKSMHTILQCTCPWEERPSILRDPLTPPVEQFFSRWMVTSFSFSFYGFASNITRPNWRRQSISTIIFLVTNIGTPYTINSMMSRLNRVIAYNFFVTRCWMRFYWMFKKLKTPTYLALYTSLPTIHL
jgi:hypothetical protein